jgi:hypothetical protein
MSGMRVVLYMTDEFEVEATLVFDGTWHGIPDWTTIRHYNSDSRTVTQEQLLEHARREALKVCDEYGTELPQIDPEDVPVDVRPLVAHANILGVGDDPSRDAIVEAVGKEYLDLARADLRNHREALRTWLATEPREGNDRAKYAALDWMVRALGVLL